MLGAAAAVSMALFGCSDVLDETPRASFTVDYFTTEEGVQGGLTQMYAHLRNLFGSYYYAACECGTDEYTWGQSADENFKDNDLDGSGKNITSTTSRTDAIWSPAFININTANNLIAQASNLDPSLVAEANFFRAFDYFLLVQHFGGVPLDLGSGELQPNSNPSRTSVRNTVPEVYTRCIFKDLQYAVENLPETPRITGALSKTVARLYLAKAYLTYAWWLENPKNIPTYPECPRTDPNGKSAKDYFQMAYNVAMEAIENPGPYALQETFYDANRASNERNPEMLLWADHTASSWMYSGAGAESNANDYGNDPGPNAFNGFWFMNWNYTELTTVDGTATQRIDRQGYGRPWTRMAPTYNVWTETFADTRDSRRDVTFQNSIHANWHVGAADAPATHKNANDLDIQKNGIVLKFVSKAIPGTVYKIAAKDAKASTDDKAVINVKTSTVQNDGTSKLTTETVEIAKNAGEEKKDFDTRVKDAIADINKPYGSLSLGVAPNESAFIVDPEHVSRKIYPGPFKISGFSQESEDVSGAAPRQYGSLGVPNANNVRPYYIAKFSELYLVAAEAAAKGATGSKTARDLVNVLRERAGKWNYSVADDKAISEDYSSALTAATPANVDVKYVLLERSREFFGEGFRRLDLVRTQMWEELAGSYKICGPAVGDYELTEVTRKIELADYLSPIPQGQLDGMEMSDEEKSAYQNPKYRTEPKAEE